MNVAILEYVYSYEKLSLDRGHHPPKGVTVVVNLSVRPGACALPPCSSSCVYCHLAAGAPRRAGLDTKRANNHMNDMKVD